MVSAEHAGSSDELPLLVFEHHKEHDEILMFSISQKRLLHAADMEAQAPDLAAGHNMYWTTPQG